MDKNQLKVNGSKIEFIIFGSKHQLQTYILKNLKKDDTLIMAKSVITFLGTYLDESLNMKTDIANRTKNVLHNLYLIKNHETIPYPVHSKNASMFNGFSHNWEYLSSVPTDLPNVTLRPFNYTQRYAASLACNKTKWDSAQGLHDNLSLATN